MLIRQRSMRKPYISRSNSWSSRSKHLRKDRKIRAPTNRNLTRISWICAWSNLRLNQRGISRTTSRCETSSTNRWRSSSKSSNKRLTAQPLVATMSPPKPSKAANWDLTWEQGHSRPTSKNNNLYFKRKPRGTRRAYKWSNRSSWAEIIALERRKQRSSSLRRRSTAESTLNQKYKHMLEV